jgi:negative regulator of replication initiation
MKMEIDSFVNALNLVEKATGKDAADILNRAMLHVVIGGKGVEGAIQLTPRADAAKIRAVNIKDVAKVVMARLRRKGRKVSAKQRDNMIRWEYMRRLKAVGYTAGPGWNNAAKSLGGRGVRTQPGFAKSQARFGNARKATPTNLIAEAVNTAPAAEEIGFAPLEKALGNVAADLVEYGTKKLQEQFDKVK